MNITRTRNAKSRGLTLVEVLLTVAVLVVVAALTWPVIQGVFDIRRLKHAGKALAAEWNDARLTAMTEGRIQVFRFEPESDRYVIEPLPSLEDTLELSDLDVLEDPQAQVPQGGIVFEENASRLPEGVVFVALLNYEDLQADVLAAPLFGAERSVTAFAPIMFYPDGTTSDAELILRDAGERSIKVSLRGLTGSAEVSETFQTGELGQQFVDAENLP